MSKSPLLVVGQTGRASSVRRNQRKTAIIRPLITHLEKIHSKASLRSNIRIRPRLNNESQSKISGKEIQFLINSKKFKEIMPSESKLLQNAHIINKEKCISDYTNLSEISTATNTIGSGKPSRANRPGDPHKASLIIQKCPDMVYDGLSQKSNPFSKAKEHTPDPIVKKTVDHLDSFQNYLPLEPKLSIKHYQSKKEIGQEIVVFPGLKKPRSRNNIKLSNYGSEAIVRTKPEEEKSAPRRIFIQFKQGPITKCPKRTNYKTCLGRSEDQSQMKEASIKQESDDESDKSDSCQTVIEKNCDNDYSLITDSLNKKY